MVCGALHCCRGLRAQDHSSWERQPRDDCPPIFKVPQCGEAAIQVQSSTPDQLSCALHSEGHTVPRSLCCLHPLGSSTRAGQKSSEDKDHEQTPTREPQASRSSRTPKHMDPSREGRREDLLYPRQPWGDLPHSQDHSFGKYGGGVYKDIKITVCTHMYENFHRTVIYTLRNNLISMRLLKTSAFPGSSSNS